MGIKKIGDIKPGMERPFRTEYYTTMYNGQVPAAIGNCLKEENARVAGITRMVKGEFVRVKVVDRHTNRAIYTMRGTNLGIRFYEGDR